MQFTTLPEFDREFKKLLKKYRSLEEDLNVLKQVLEKKPPGICTSYCSSEWLGYSH